MDVRTVLLFSVLQILSSLALPVKYDTNSSCIHMTTERVKELNDLSEEFNKFINKLSDKYEDIDFTFVEVRVENHTEDEDEEKETTLKITVKDCDSKAKKLIRIEDKYYNNDDITDSDDDSEELDDSYDEKAKQQIKREDTVENNQEFDKIHDKNNNIKKVSGSNGNVIENHEDINLKNESITRNLNKTVKKTYINENIDETDNVLVKRTNKHINRTETDSDIDVNERNENKKTLERDEKNIERDDKKIERENAKTDDKMKDFKVNEGVTNNPKTDIVEGVTNENEAENFDKTIDSAFDQDAAHNVIIYAPHFDNRVIQIGGYDSYLSKLLYKLAANQLSKDQTQLYQSPKENYDYSQQNADYDSYVDYILTDKKQIDEVPTDNKIKDVSTDDKLIYDVTTDKQLVKGVSIEGLNVASENNFEAKNAKILEIIDDAIW